MVGENAHSHGLNNHTHSFSWSGTTGNMSKNSTGSWGTRVSNSTSYGTGDNRYTPYANGNIQIDTTKQRMLHQRPDDGYTASNELYYSIDVSHTHTYSGSGTTGGSSNNTTSTTSTGNFKGTAGTTGSNGEGTGFSILPPYIVKYCWERTA